MSSRGAAISAYSPAFAKGAKVYGANIAPDSITSAHIAAGTIVAADVAAGSITSAKLGTGAATFAKMRAAQITGNITSSGITYAKAHGLGAVPSLVIVSLRATLAHISGGASVGEAKASARTSTNFYVVGKPHGVGFAALCIV